MNNIKVGYQGLEGSNAEVAARKFFKGTSKDVEFIPLISSKNCIDTLNKNDVDFIVCAIKNSIAGIVQETKDAIKNENVVLLKTVTIPIHHCIFAYKDFDIKNAKFIASHIQALKQTENYRKKHFKDLKEVEIADTALAAKMLANNELDSNTLIICRKNAGELYGLKLICENIEDDKNNKTEFGLFELKK